MKLKIEIETDNAAFEDSDEELSRILKEIAYNPTPRKLRDINGNVVGRIYYTGGNKS